MTFDQTKDFVVGLLISRKPVFFSDYVMTYIDSIGYLENDMIAWAGKKYRIVGADQASGIVETRRVAQKAPTTRAAGASVFSR